MTTARRARAAGFTYRWESDWQIGSHCEEYGPDYGEPRTCEWAAIFAPGADWAAASVGCVDDADETYRMQIEDELASEASDVITSVILRKLADRLFGAPTLGAPMADLCVRLDHAANRLAARAGF